MRRALKATMLIGLLASCGSQQNEIGAMVLGAARSALPGQQAAAAGQQGVTRAALQGRELPLLVARLETRDAVAGLVVAGQNDGHVTWRTLDGITLTLRDGVLASTRGLGNDLMSAYVAETVTALQRGQGQEIHRVHRYLDGENQLVTITFVCTATSGGIGPVEVIEQTYSARHVRESCAAPDRQFVNDYWIGSDGFIWKSRQFVGVEMGHIQLEQAVR